MYMYRCISEPERVTLRNVSWSRIEVAGKGSWVASEGMVESVLQGQQGFHSAVRRIHSLVGHICMQLHTGKLGKTLID